MKIENEALFRQYLGDGINLFLGAGFSVESESAIGKSPVGDDLRTELLTHFGVKQPSRLTLPQLCATIQSTRATDLRSYLKRRFTITRFDPRYSVLEQVNIRAIFTTNIDDLVHNIYSKSTRHYLNDLLLRGPSISGKNAIEFIPLHGCVAHENADFDFTPIELASSFARDRDKWFGFVGRLQNTPTLYWGYRLEDAGVLEALHRSTVNERSRKEAWITLRSPDEDSENYFRSLGFQIIIADTAELLDYFTKIAAPTPAHISTTALELFPEFNIPSIGTTPARSIVEFYAGAEPSWNDIYSGKIYEISHMLKAKNRIAQGKNLMLIGATATGKSTLIRQLACHIEYKGLKLFINEISNSKAELLARAINADKTPVLIFLDNIADSTDGIAPLLATKSVQIIGAERDYYYDSISHRFEKGKFALLDVSDLTDNDIQEIENRIPREIVKAKFSKSTSHLASSEQPTIFEVIDGTIRDNSLSERYVKTLSHLKEESMALHDLLIMICYVYSCRIPSSLDMAASFLHEYGINVAQVHEMIESLGGTVAYYEGALADSRQDYFVPRSTPISDAVMSRLKPQDLSRILWTFHEGVSPTKIPRYDIFKRRAYDEHFASRAFPNVEDGIRFYNYVYNRDPSPYLRQQGALYCQKRHDLTTAFNWIDEARAKTGDRNPTIRNSYAVILFRANVDRPIDATVTATLQESMQILEECYGSDKRKVYHAKVFADQAMQYAKKYMSTKEAVRYLELAKDWLLIERAERPDDRRMKTQIREVSGMLGSL